MPEVWKKPLLGMEKVELWRFLTSTGTWQIAWVSFRECGEASTPTNSHTNPMEKRPEKITGAPRVFGEP